MYAYANPLNIESELSNTFVSGVRRIERINGWEPLRLVATVHNGYEGCVIESDIERSLSAKEYCYLLHSSRPFKSLKVLSKLQLGERVTLTGERFHRFVAGEEYSSLEKEEYYANAKMLGVAWAKAQRSKLEKYGLPRNHN